MRALAIDTSGMTASAAVVDDSDIIGEISTHYKRNHAEILMPMISRLFELLSMKASETELIACAAGPGSFTGLRIGAATAKAFAYALNKPIAPVPTLDALAYNANERDSLIIPMMDARRSQVYTAFYLWDGGDFPMKIMPEQALEMEEVLVRAATYKREAFFLGDGAHAYLDKIKSSGLGPIAAPTLKQRASSVGAVGIRMAKRGETVTGGAFVPSYYRKPQAERERELRG